MLRKALVTGALAAFVCMLAPAALAENGHGGQDRGGKAGAKMFEKLDENGDGSVSHAEFLAHAGARFAKMDADGDGTLTQSEAEAFRKSMRENMRERMQERREKRKARNDGGDDVSRD